LLNAQRTDILVLKNGDHVQGEIKILNNGVLTFKTDDIGTLSVKWKDVVKLSSIHTFELVKRNGRIVYGSLDTTKQKFNIVIVYPDSRDTISLFNLIKITQLRNTFFRRLSGNISIGGSYTKGSDVLKFNSSLSLKYRSRHDELILTNSSHITLQGQGQNSNFDENITKKLDGRFTYLHYFDRSWYFVSYTGAEQNTEIAIQARLLLGVGGGKYLFQNYFHKLGTTASLMGNNETKTDGSSTNNLEFAFRVDYSIYKHTRPKIILNTDFSVYPSISNPGRLRYDGNISADFELVKDFSISISAYTNFDNQGESESTSNFDWGFNTGLAYKFNQ
jgi:Protein of unknown function, DUF481